MLPGSRVRSLADAEGRFPTSLSTVVRRLATGRVRRSELRAEWGAQIRRARDSGFRVSHVDGHKHVHVMPGLVSVIRAVLEDSGVRGIRLPREPGAGPRRRVRGALMLASSRAAGFARAPDRVVGVAQAGGLHEDGLVGLLRQLPEGTSELVSHPGRPGPELPAAMLAAGLVWGAAYAFGDELEALTSARVRAEVDAQGVELLSWEDFLAGG